MRESTREYLGPTMAWKVLEKAKGVSWALSYAVLVSSAIATAWGLVAFLLSLFLRKWKSDTTILVVVSLLVLSLVCSPFLARASVKAGEQRRVYSTGVCSVKALCMIFVAIIHTVCDDWANYFVYRHIVDQAVPMLFVCLGITSSRYSSSTKVKLVNRYATLLGPYYVFSAINWTYRYVDGSVWIKKYSTRDHAVLLTSSLLGFSPCMGGAWFVFPLLQVLMLVHLFGRIKSKERFLAFLFLPSLLFGSLSNSFVRVDMEHLTATVSDHVVFDCDPYGTYKTIMLWDCWIGYVVAGMWFSTFHSRIKRWTWSIPLAMASMSLSVIAGTLHKGSLWWDLSNQCSTIALTFAFVIVFDRFQWLAPIYWVGDCSWTFYLGQISLLNFVKRGTCSVQELFVAASPYLLFFQLALLFGWAFSAVMNKKKLRKSMSSSARRKAHAEKTHTHAEDQDGSDISTLPLLDLTVSQDNRTRYLSE